MEKLKKGLAMAIVAFVTGAALMVIHPGLIAATPAADPVVTLPSSLWAWAGSVQPIEQQLSSAVRAVLHGGRSTCAMLMGLFWDVVDWWKPWLKGLVFSLAVAIVAALADKGLLDVWRAEGFGIAVRDATLMLYVYARLLLSNGVGLAPKLLFVGALIYGVVQNDFVPDTSLVPGRVEDVVLMVIATRAFIYACPDALLNEYAGRAVSFRQRIASFQRPR
jgi:uncharacterized membrane protein YkvA (DUF1232 family)